MTTNDDERRMRGRIDDHFAGRIAPDAEQDLRGHLPSCADCRAHYERHLLLAELDPRALDAKDRIGSALGVPARGRADRRWMLGALGAAAAAVALVVVAPRRPAPEDGFVARGARPMGAPPNELRVFRLRPGGAAAPLGEAMARADELAFAYRNPARLPRLLVYGVDEHGHVYWYHPAWSDEAENPVAVAISTAPGEHELPAAIAHPIDGRRLDIVGLFVPRSVSVREVEQALARNGPGTGTPLLPDAVEVRTRVTIEP